MFWRLWRPRRAIFRFRVGGRWEYRDPVQVRRALAVANPKWSELVDLVVKCARPLPQGVEPVIARARQEQADGAAADLAALVSAAFGVPPLQPDGSGLTEPELISLLGDFVLFTSELMEETRPLAVSPPATDSAGGG